MEEQTDPLLLEVEFTHRWYHDFVERLLTDGFEFRGFSDRLGAGEVVLRHDVDLSLEAALELAHIEADLGVRGTYFILLNSKLYNPFSRAQRDRIQELERLGHDVALHFSTHEYWEGDVRPREDTLLQTVTDELSVLETVTSKRTEVVSFHIPPEWVLGRSFEGFRSTYAPAYFEDAEYVADSSQRWRTDPPDVDGSDGPVQILTHPGLWGETDADFEGRIEQAIVGACRDAQRAARAEFIDGVYDR